MNAIELLETLNQLGIKYSVHIEIVAEEEGSGGGDPPPPDEPELANFVCAEKVVLKFARDYNRGGYPIMEIYPSDTSVSGDRVKFLAGETVRVYPEKIRADGAEYFYKVSPEYWKNPQIPLYAQESRGTII